ncbi:MAG: hypothetical protein VX699_13690 [Myxococcota bacterium]|nr:hypothetical protein [Myxococcota bacterium]
MSIHKAGQDIDSYCGKCKMTLAHVIVAMEGTKVARAQCKTCYATHAYRKDPALKAKKTTTPRASSKANTKPRFSATEFDVVMSQRNIAKARQYGIRETFVESDVIDHKKFGLGAVTSCLADNKIEVLFREGPKTLVHSR